MQDLTTYFQQKELDTRMIDMTFGDFLEKAAPVIRDIITEVVASKGKAEEHEYAYGLQGMAHALGCSIAKASRMKASGEYDSAIFQDGRTFSVDVTAFRELMQQKQQKLVNHNDLHFRHKK